MIVEHEDPVALLRDIRDQRVIAGLPIAALQRLAEIMKVKRKKLISAKDVADYVAEATSGLPMIRVEKGSANWAAWCEQLRKQNLPAMVKFYEGQGFMKTWTLWPHWHPQYRPELADGRAA